MRKPREAFAQEVQLIAEDIHQDKQDDERGDEAQPILHLLTPFEALFEFSEGNSFAAVGGTAGQSGGGVAQPARGPPVIFAQQVHDGRDEEHADNGGVDKQGKNHAVGNVFHHHDIGEAERAGDHDHD